MAFEQTTSTQATLSQAEKIRYISSLPLFSELKPEEIALLEPHFRVEHFRAGEYVYRQAERSYALYLFVSGRGRLLRVGEDGIERRGEDVEPGEFVGERSLFLYEERPQSLVIVRDATVLVLPKRNFDEFIARHPAIKARLNIREDVRQKLIDHDFPWLNPEEQVLAYTRRHIWAFWRRALLAIPIFFLLLPLPLVLYLVPLVPRFLVVVGVFPMLFFPTITVIYNYFDWRNDWFVITNQRVVHEERVLLTFNETRDQAPLTSIQSVRTQQHGVFAEYFGFADLIIATAGAGGTLVFDTLENAEELRELLNQELVRKRSHRAAMSREQIRAEIDNFIGVKALNRTRAEDLPPPARPPNPPPPPTETVRSRAEQLWQQVLNYFDLRVRIDEGFRVIYRRHWLVLWNDIFPPTFFLVLALILLVVNIIWHWAWPWAMFHPLVRVLFFVLLFPALIAWWWWMYEDWHNDLYIIDKQTVTRLHRRPLWIEDEKSIILIRHIQGVHVSINGIWQKLFNYGTVTIQTAAEDDNPADQVGGETVLPYIYQPYALQEDILRQQRQKEEEEEQEEVDQTARQIARWLAIYHQATHPEDFDTSFTRGESDKGSVRGGAPGHAADTVGPFTDEG